MEGLQRRRSLRDRGAASTRKQRRASALKRLVAGRGGVDDIAGELRSGCHALFGRLQRHPWLPLAAERQCCMSLLPSAGPPPAEDGGSSDGEEDGSDDPKPAWGRCPWPRPPLQRQGAGGGGGLEDGLEDESEDEEEERDWDANLGEFVVEDEGHAAAAFAEL